MPGSGSVLSTGYARQLAQFAHIECGFWFGYLRFAADTEYIRAYPTPAVPLFSVRTASLIHT
jgi:hypothetical protein